ncbi:MAG: AMP-binding protein [Chitinophagales bacterium]
MHNSKHKTIDDIQAVQETELKKLLHYLNQHSVFYKKHFAKHSIDINTISLANLSSIPPTTKEDLQQYNNDFLCVAKNQVAEYCATSGTLGKPVTIALTANDLSRLAYNEVLSFQSVGCNNDDVFQLMLTLDKQFMAGIAYYSGIQQLGAGSIRMGAGNIAAQIDSMLNHQSTVLVAVPSFVLKIIEFAQENNVDLNKTSVQKIICIGENIQLENNEYNELAKRILKHWNVELFSTYASTEKQTAFTSCTQHNGNHAHPELLIFEIVDENDQPLKANEFGELVITTLGVEGMPLLRYKTGDICCYYDTACACGDASFRLSPIVGRKNQLIKFKGTTLYPSTIFNVLNSLEEIQDYFIELRKSDIDTDELFVYISLYENKEIHQQKISQILQSSLRVLPNIDFIQNDEIKLMQTKASNRKLNKFADNRN